MLWTWVFSSKNNFYFVHIRRAGCSFLSWRDKEEMRTMGFLYGMSYYSSGLVLWILIFFFFFIPRPSILFPMDLILHSFMLMLLQWSSLISKAFLHVYNLSHPKATFWRQCMLNVSIPFSKEIKSVERHEWGQQASFPVLCVQGKRQQFGGNVNVMDCTFVHHCTKVWQETLGAWFRKK